MRHKKHAGGKSKSEKFSYFKTKDFHDSVRILIAGIVAGVSMLVLYQNIQENKKTEDDEDSVITELNQQDQNLKSPSEKNEHPSELPHLFSLPVLPNSSIDETRNMDQTTQPLARSPLDQPPEDTVGGMDVRIRQKPAVVEQRPENAKIFRPRARRPEILRPNNNPARPRSRKSNHYGWSPQAQWLPTRKGSQP